MRKKEDRVIKALKWVYLERWVYFYMFVLWWVYWEKDFIIEIEGR